MSDETLLQFVRRVHTHAFPGALECGASWRVRLPANDEDLLAVCVVCGETTANLTDLGPVHSAGLDVEP